LGGSELIDALRLDLIKRKHGAYASWAVWAPPSGVPKSNMSNMDVLDERRNPALLETLNPSVVMIALNVASRSLSGQAFRNFHDPSPVANDFKIRFAFTGTQFWGAYMTDVIKDFPETVSGRLLHHLKAHPEIVPRHVDTLRAELADLPHHNPVILAFGGGVHALLQRHLTPDDYSLLIGLTHYSHRISKENYRERVHQQIAVAQRRSV
jgi:hypothetical protein